MCMHIYSPTLPDHMFHILCIHDIHHNSPLSTLVRDRFGFIITICYTSVSTEFIFFHWEYLYCFFPSETRVYQRMSYAGITRGTARTRSEQLPQRSFYYQRNEPLPQRHIYHQRNNYTNQYTNFNRNQGFYQGKHRGEVDPSGKQLFLYMRDYANNFYSLLLMRMDLEMSTNSPKRGREFLRIMRSLNQSQVIIKDRSPLSEHQRKLESLAMDLCLENTKLMEKEYEVRSNEILQSIHSLLRNKINSIPLAEKVFNYVKPNMQKRRFFEKIQSNIIAELNKILSDINMRYQSFHQSTQHQATSSIRLDQPLNRITKKDANTEMIVVENEDNEGWITVKIRQKQSKNLVRPTASMETDQGQTSTEKRKRKGPSESEIVSSDDENRVIKRIVKGIEQTPKPLTSINVDMDSISSELQLGQSSISNLPQTSLVTNCVKTVSESVTKYKSFAPSRIASPKFATPPESPYTGRLSENMHKDILENMKMRMNNSCQLSQPDTCVFTLHSKLDCLIPPTHAALEVTPQILTHREVINQIPRAFSNFILEVFITPDNYNTFKDQFRNFSLLADHLDLPYMFTVPEENADELHELINHTNMQEWIRPFPRDPSLPSQT
jgi:hypothetical protein